MYTFNRLTNSITWGVYLFLFAALGLLLCIGLATHLKDTELNQEEYAAFVAPLLSDNEGLGRIPKSAFWAGKDAIGHWFDIESMHAHKNRVRLSIYDGHDGHLIKTHDFHLICPSDAVIFMDTLDWRIAFYDGTYIRFYDACYLMPY